ncbi:AAA family ATPase [Alkaliphilus peptidifermentans]|uniref:Uncharacterized protein YhaN n=1 Tax=Alkaliphilus peptidifermentans DSM 18978 TaxID=1120976 RepID=A0A1G5K8X1_9FIRM|nr:AAA family ATPase [Alkaliphilus peptidifermentans]SCY97093.1 Uncharacterized protein YhaN [Alkaliphilus peptidifermentans DSM 18978]
MKIHELNIKSFGRFTDEPPMKDLNKNLVLFYGKNETGKTTIFHLIRSIFYGFSPASRDLHPYNPWEIDRIDIAAKLLLDNGVEAEVNRRLLSTPRGQLIYDSNVLELKNNPLPYVNHISTEIYEKIYSLRVEDLVQLQGKGWDEIQDKLLANYGSQLIRSTRDVIKELQDEANGLYRESGRGNFLIKKLEDEMKSLKKQRLDAINRQKEIREQQERLLCINQLIGEKNSERVRLKQLVGKAKKLTPFKALINDLKNTNQSFINKGLYEKLPINTPQKRDELQEKVNQLNTSIEDNNSMIELKENKIYRLTEEEQRILENKASINKHVKNTGSIQYLKDVVVKYREEIYQLKDRVNYESRKLLNEDLQGEVLENIKDLNISEARLLLEGHRKIKAELDEANKDYQYMSNKSLNIKVPVIYLVFAVAGIIMTLAGYGLNINFLPLAGILLAVFGGGSYITSLMLKKQLDRQAVSQEEKRSLQKKITQLQQALAEKKNDLINIYKGIPLPEIVILNMDEILLSGIIKMKDDLYQLREKSKYADEKEKLLNIELDELQRFLRTLNIEGNEESKLNQIKDQLDDLEKRVIVNNGLNEELQGLRKERSILLSKLEENTKELKDIDEKLRQLGNGEIILGLKIFKDNQKLEDRIKLIDEKLMEWSNIEELKAELEALESEDPWIFLEAKLEEAEIKIEEIEVELQSFRDEKKDIELSMEQLSKTITIDEIESQLIMLELEHEEVCIKRDRLILLAEIIKLADEEFREENQPNVLKNASQYFKLITNGKYANIYLEETDTGDSIMVREVDSLAPQAVTESFSKGTLNQLYLSLRLSLMDHLDKDSEKLPVCFDELFINWDEERLENNLKLLTEISRERQIFFFTCHDWLASKIEATFKTSRISLS